MVMILNKSNYKQMSLTNIANRKRLQLRGYKLGTTAPAQESSTRAGKPTENTEQESFTEAACRIFKLEPAGFNSSCFTNEEKYLLDERAGIYEFEAGLSRAEAESRAINDIIIKQTYKNE